MLGHAGPYFLGMGWEFFQYCFIRTFPTYTDPNLIVATRKWSNAIYLRDFLSVNRLKNELGFWKTATVTRFYWDGIS